MVMIIPLTQGRTKLPTTRVIVDSGRDGVSRPGDSIGGVLRRGTSGTCGLVLFGYDSEVDSAVTPVVDG